MAKLATNLMGKTVVIVDDAMTRGNQFLDQRWLGMRGEIVTAFSDEDGYPKYSVQVKPTLKQCEERHLPDDLAHENPIVDCYQAWFRVVLEQ